MGDQVKVFDAASPSGELATVTAKTATTLTLDKDLSGTYTPGYPSSVGRGAAVAVPSKGVFDANVEGRVIDAYGGAPDGADGGCFVEVKLLPDGGGTVPFRVTMKSTSDTSDQKLWDFSDVWFKNKSKSNYFHLIGATHYTVQGDSIAGLTWTSSTDSIRIIYIFVKELETNSATVANPQTANAETFTHELGHKFIDRRTRTNPDTDRNHPSGVWCHLGQGTDHCFMGYESNPTDAYSELDIDPPTHLLQVRDQVDDL